MDLLILDCGDTIKGECTITGYIDKIELLSYSHGVAMQITGDPSNQKRTSGKPNHQDMTVTKYVDLATALLIEYCNKGTAIAKLKLSVGQNEEGKMNAIITYDMDNVVVSSVSVGGGGGGKPQETVTLNYTKMTWTYKPQVPKGEIKGQNSTIWDLSTNTAT
jgi:type VI secretion system secreted protein Hcp